MSKIFSLAIAATVAITVGCGGAIQTECTDTGSASAPLEIAVPSAHESAELAILGDCTGFSCKKPTKKGCALWAGRIATRGGATCQIVLSKEGVTLQSTRIDGVDACGVRGAQVVVDDD